MDTINRLLHKQEPKRKKKTAGGPDEFDEDGNEIIIPAPAMFIRYTTNINGSILAVPSEWVDAPAGEIFHQSIKPLKAAPPLNGRLVQELD